MRRAAGAVDLPPRVAGVARPPFARRRPVAPARLLCSDEAFLPGFVAKLPGAAR